MNTKNDCGVTIIKIKELREELGVSQNELASRVGVGQSTVAMWENNTNLPRADKLPEIAKVLGCTINDLFGEEAG